MKECFRVNHVEINRNFGSFEPRFSVRVDFCIVDEHGFESTKGWQEKSCSTWAEVEHFISRWR